MLKSVKMIKLSLENSLMKDGEDSLNLLEENIEIDSKLN